MPNEWQHRRCERCRFNTAPRGKLRAIAALVQTGCGIRSERFKAGTKGRRKRRLEASDKLPGT
jgi:hypothetical protein